MKLFMRLFGLGEKPTVNKPEPKLEPEKELDLPQEVIDEIKRWRHIAAFANTDRANNNHR